MEKLYEFLRKEYGNHQLAAAELGISFRQYRRIRNQDKEPPEKFQRHVRLLVDRLKLKKEL